MSSSPASDDSYPVPSSSGRMKALLPAVMFACIDEQEMFLTSKAQRKNPQSTLAAADKFLECYKKVGDLVDASPCAVVFESYQKCLDGDSRSPHGLCKAFKDEASSCAAKHFGKGL